MELLAFVVLIGMAFADFFEQFESPWQEPSAAQRREQRARGW